MKADGIELWCRVLDTTVEFASKLNSAAPVVFFNKIFEHLENEKIPM